MKPKKMQKEMQFKFNNGATRAEIFDEYKHQSLPEKRVASLVASLKDDTLCQLFSGRNNILIGFMFFQALLAAIVGYSAGLSIGGQAPFWLAGIATAIAFLFIIGFYRYSLVAYLAYIFISISQLPKLFQEPGDSLLALLIALSVSLGGIAFVWHIKSKLYPFFSIFGAKKTNSGFSFNDHTQTH